MYRQEYFSWTESWFKSWQAYYLAYSFIMGPTNVQMKYGIDGFSTLF